MAAVILELRISCCVSRLSRHRYNVGCCRTLCANDFVLFIVRVIYMCTVELACNWPEWIEWKV